MKKTIKELVEKSNSRTKRKYTRVMFEDGSDGICWIPELIAGLKAGDTADFEISTSETGVNTITAVKRLETAEPEEDMPFADPAPETKVEEIKKPEPEKTPAAEVKPQPKEEKEPVKEPVKPAAPAKVAEPAVQNIPAPTDSDVPPEANDLPKRKAVKQKTSIWEMYKGRKEAFPLLGEDEIEVRVATCNEKGVSLLLYKDARADQIRFDAVFGPKNWKKEYHSLPEFPGRLICRVSVKDEETGEWIAKEDFGTESNTEAEKGQASDAFKRACVCWGSGRELYSAPFIWVKADDTVIKEYKGRPKCDDTFVVKTIAYDERDQIAKLEIWSKAKKRIVFSY